MMSLQRKALVAVAGAVALLAVQAANASAIYQIYVNTTEIQGTTGYIDFQFNPGFPPISDPAYALVDNFDSDGTLTTPASDIGDVSGAFPGSVQINNTDQTNDHAEGFIFGSFFDVFVDLEIPSISGNASSGSSFFLSVLDSGFNPLITSGSLVEIDLDTLGNPTVTNNSPNSEATVTVAPEPASLMLLAIGLTGIIVRRAKPARS
jgi:hypothetical protein